MAVAEKKRGIGAPPPPVHCSPADGSNAGRDISGASISGFVRRSLYRGCSSRGPFSVALMRTAVLRWGARARYFRQGPW